MENQLSEAELKELARQLGHPQGENGLGIAQRLADNNKGMVQQTIDELRLTPNEVVLEIGQADAPHLHYFLAKAPHLVYFGADISQEMTDLAKANHRNYTQNHQAYFYQVDGRSLPFPTLRFDKVFTVNTIYFWENASAYLEEIKRVLRPGGTLTLAFADKEFMAKLPFTPFGFKLYSINEVKQLLAVNGFNIVSSAEKWEKVQTSAEVFTERNYWLVTARI